MKEEEGIKGECPACGGEGEPLGLLGFLLWFRCIRCGIKFHVNTKEKGAKK
jgi:uncharacterized protein (DUF983 family)